VLSLVAFFVMMGVSIISPILPAYALTFGVSLALVGLLVSGFGISRMFLNIPAGILGARFGMRRLMLLGLVIIAISSILAGLAVNYPMLLMARVAEGAGSALYTTTSIIAVSRLAPRESRGAHLSLYLSMFLVGTSLGPVVGGLVSQQFGLNAPFLVYGLCGATSFLMVLFWITDVPAVPEETGTITRGQLKRLLFSFELLSIYLATFAIFVMRQGLMNTIVPLYAEYNLSISQAALGLMLTVSALGNLVTMAIAGPLTDRYGRKWFMITALVLVAALIFAIPLAHDAVTLTVILGLMGLAVGMSGPVAAWITDVAEPRDLGGAMGLFRTIGDLGFVIAPVMLAALAGEAGKPVGLLPFIVAGAIVLLLALPLLRTRDPIAEKRRKGRQT
jgi:MFS transporter, DHA1 family, multidrug resistance protein